MKICLLGDTHFGIRADSKIFHSFYEKFYSEVFFPELEKRDIKTIIQLGDLFDRRKYVNFYTLAESRRYFFDQCKVRGITLHALIGNHDIFWRESLEVNSPDLLLKDYDNTHLWMNPGTLDLDGVSIDMIPWICKENEKEIFDLISKSSSSYCMGHFELSGFPLMRGIESQDGIDGDFLENYSKVFSGHYHTFSEKDNITYIGTPYELFWSDYKDEKRFAIFDTESAEVEYIENPNVVFHKIHYDDVTMTESMINKMTFDKYADCYVKVVVMNKQNPYLFDLVMDKLYKSSPADIAIVEDFTNSFEEGNDEIVNQAEDTITILSKFIDGQPLNISDPDKLKTLMRELYVEALSQENTE